jgi:integrase
MWYLGWFDASLGREVRRSLRTRDEEEAKRLAGEKANERRQGVDLLRCYGSRTVKEVFAWYRRFRSPDKSTYCRRQDERLEELLTRFVGPGFDLRNWSRREHDEFIRLRTSGRIDARGRPVPNPEDRVQVGPATVGQDLAVLSAVYAWGMKFRDDTGQLLFTENPMQGLPIPKELNPNRPVATTERVQAIREQAPKVRMRVEWNGRREYVESFLPEIFDLAVETGRRIGAICRLRTEDLRLEPTDTEPFGCVVWPSSTDKCGREWAAPLNPKARAAIDSALKKRAALGPRPLFPAAKDRSKPVRIERAAAWLRKAEELAKLEHLEGTAFHSFRRYWATCRKGLSDRDVMAAGGWASLAALKASYQRPDADRMLAVVMHQAELRQIR